MMRIGLSFILGVEPESLCLEEGRRQVGLHPGGEMPGCLGEGGILQPGLQLQRPGKPDHPW